jgi:hypothetical protein
MHHLVEAFIEPLYSVHHIGNVGNEESLHLSKKANKASEELLIAFREYFLKPFKLEEYFHFNHETDLALNEVYTYAKAIFENPESLHEQSENLAKHLYKQSEHPNIKGGEFYVVHIKDCFLEGEEVEALGLFKSESRDTFLDIQYHSDGVDVIPQEGVSINKLDKGCIIFNSKKEEGYVLSVVDGTNKNREAQFWRDDFLDIIVMKNEFHQTNEFLDVTKQFVTKQLSEDFEVGKTDQIDILNRSMDYFKEKQTFQKEEFEEEVLGDKEVIESFRKFNETYQEEKEIEIEENFDISQQAVKKNARVFKSVLKLDKNFHIYIHGDKNLIEPGVDDNGRKFYKIFYNSEQ